eukprot:GHVL01010273.1.p4 GENE.GHVL01010273.1~~GHVL01010273.1.p4  ORF type:complete len:112 (+),score=14.86 GHVL01010273.1:1675-2010(+)
MPPHFRRWMHRFMKKCQANNGQCPAGAGANAAGQPTEAESSTGTSGAQQPDGCPMGNAQDEYLNHIGENISAFLDPFGRFVFEERMCVCVQCMCFRYVCQREREKEGGWGF